MRAGNSFTFNSSRPLIGLSVLLAILVGAVLEYAVFRNGYMLADRSTLAIVYKANRLEEGHSEDVIILGPSTALAIDATELQQAVGNRLTIYNYSLPNLGSAEQYYFVLKKYLRFNRKPKVVLLAVPTDLVSDEDLGEASPLIDESQRQRFMRFFGPRFLLTDVRSKAGDWQLAAAALSTMLPSVNYRSFIKSGTFAPQPGETWDWQGVGTMNSLLERNRGIVDRLARTHGQLVYNAARTVERAEVDRTLVDRRAAGRLTTTFIEEFIRLAQSNDIVTRLLFTPVCCERRAFADSVRAALTDVMTDYVRRYPGFRFMEVGPPSLDREYFGDPIHLNERGAARLNAELKRDFPALLSETGAEAQRVAGR